MKDSFSTKRMLLLFGLTFGAWVVCFRGFLFMELGIRSDAIAYYEHFRYFIENIIQGIYPMWEPERHMGFPVEFFLRRIGSFNPLYLFLAIPVKLGAPFYAAYMAFLAGYYFLGMAGFYLLAKLIFGDKRSAFVAFLILMFSSLATRLFDSYFLLAVIPMIWFFYFLLSFARYSQAKSLIGMTLCLMILVTTYIPFYFVMIFLAFLMMTALFYFQHLRTGWQNMAGFFTRQRWLTLFCLLAFGLSLIPGTLMFVEGRKDGIVLPERQASATTESIVGVGIDTITTWGIEEDLAYAAEYADLRLFKFAIMYVPCAALIILLCGWLLPCRKRYIFLFLWGAVLMLMFSHRAPIYGFLYDHVFFFKYFRNLHFFLWMALLPLFILLCAEQFHQFQSIKITKDNRRRFLIYALCVHAVFLVAVFIFSRPLWTTIVTVGLSVSLFAAVVYHPHLRNQFRFLCLLLILVVMQPLQVYGYLGKNSQPIFSFYRYSDGLPRTRFPEQSSIDNAMRKMADLSPQQLHGFQKSLQSNVYVGMEHFIRFASIVPQSIVDFYLTVPFVAYDSVEKAEEPLNEDQFRRRLKELDNTALVHTPQKLWPMDQGSTSKAEIIRPDSQHFTLVSSDANEILLETKFTNGKFLVFYDNFHKGWRSYIDGERQPLYRANLAFKGIHIPAGKHTVIFRFGEPWRYVLNWGLLILFQVMLWVLISMTIKNFRIGRKSTA